MWSASSSSRGINLLSGIGAYDALETPGSGLGVLISATYGISTIIANIAWLIPFVDLGPRRCITTLVLAILFGSLTGLAIGLAPIGARFILLTAAGAASAVLFLALAKVRTGNPAFHDDPANDAWPMGAPATDLTPARTFSRSMGLLRHLWGPLVVYAALTMLNGFCSAFMVDPTGATGTVIVGGVPVSSLAKYLASLAAAVVVALVAFCANRTFDLCRTFTMAFPVVAALLAILPFLDSAYNTLLASALVFLGGIVNISIMFLLIEAARMRDVPAVPVLAAAMLVARLALVLGLMVGFLLGSRVYIDALVRSLVMVVVGILVLSYALAAILGKQYEHAGGGTRSVGDYHTVIGDVDAPATGQAVDDAQVAEPEVDKDEKRAAELAGRYHLTPGETKVIVLMAKGRSASRIAEELDLSANTVRGYARRAYVKLDIHSKQELIDLFM